MSRLLLTNDDGIDAPGIAALARAVERFERELIVVAPMGACSGCGHSVTTDRPVRLEPRGEGRFAVDGLPADCVRLGLHALNKNADWVLSGINAGGNLGADVWLSGTVAAAREAVLHGVPSIAFSHYIARGRRIDWDWAAEQVARVIPALMARGPIPGALWNVNLPHPEPGGRSPRIVLCPVDPHPLPLSYRHEGDDAHRYDGDYHTRARAAGADVDVCFGGDIAVSLVPLLPSVDVQALVVEGFDVA